MTAIATLMPTETEIGNTLKLAKALHESGFLPRSVDTPAKATALIMTGREMGLGPMASIRSIAIVDGKPIVAADLQLGLFKRAGGRARFTQLDDQGAVLALRHPNGDEHVESFTIADAKAAGLTGKDNWRKYPKAMLRSRVITAGLKSVGFEPLAGAYDPEELGVEVEMPEPPKITALPKPPELLPTALLQAEIEDLLTDEHSPIAAERLTAYRAQYAELLEREGGPNAADLHSLAEALGVAVPV